MLEGQLNLLLEFFHLHFFLEPGPVWRGDIVTTIIPMKLTLISEPVVWGFSWDMHEGQQYGIVVWSVCVCDWHLPADINTKAENRAISSSDRCIEHKFFPNSKTELIKSSQPATAKDREKGRRMSKSKEKHSLLIFIGREAHREGRRRGRDEKERHADSTWERLKQKRQCFYWVLPPRRVTFGSSVVLRKPKWGHYWGF